MKLPANWRSAVVSLLVSGSALGAVWHSMHHQRAGRENGGGHHQPQPQPAANPSDAPAVKALTEQEADAILQKMRHLLGTLTYNGVPQPEELPVDMVFPVLEGLPPADLIFLLKRAESEKDEVMRNGLRRVLFAACSMAAPEEALNAAGGWPPEFADKLLPPVLAAWRLQNGDAALWFGRLEKKRPGDWKQSRYQMVPEARGEPAPPGDPAPPSLTAAWEETSKRYDNQAPGTWSPNVLTPLVAWATETNQWSQALRQLDLLPDHQWKRDREYVLSQWARKDWRGWLEWERAHPERRASDYPYGFSNMLETVAGHFQRHLQPDDEEKDLTELTAFMDQYMASMASLPKPMHEWMSGMGLLREWAKYDPEQASFWLDRQKPGPVRDKAAETLAKTMIGEDPVPAVAWAASIADPALRETALVECWKTWRGLEPAPADAWIDERFPEIRASAARLAQEKK